MELPRASGIQLHLTSLPDGRLGPSAYAFVDWLQAAGQSVWQLLPLGPPDEHGSPYKARSAFAAWSGLLAEPDAPVSRGEADAFRARNAYWIDSWPQVADQVRFDREWSALRAYAGERGVRLMGDVPIYVAPGSADTAAWPRFFRSDGVAGVPPDAYAETGQLWGNPLYDWEALAADGYRWWTERFRRSFAQFDLVRVDHFRAFSAFWEVPADADTALRGRWVSGPGRAPFDAAAAELGELPVVAEDLGDIDAPVLALRDALGFPGMAVLQFAFDPDDTEHGTHEPANLVEHQVVYTGTHDSDTVVGWWEALSPARRANAHAAFAEGSGPTMSHGINWAMLRLAWEAPSRLAVTQAQDVLGLGSPARMNVPGTQGRSWRWRLEPGQLTPEHAARLRALTEATGRLA